MKTNKQFKMYEQIKTHGENLKKIFQVYEADPIEICKKLRQLEQKAHKLAEDYCNGENGVDSENWEEKCRPILDKVDALLHFRFMEIDIFVNGDCRGYALKISDDDAKGLMIHKDWGGYGIIAPDFTPRGN